jgi:hypothetical protein
VILFQPPAKHRFSQIKIAFVTGLSNPHRCCLSRVQKEFINRLEFPAYKLDYNFPFIPADGEENETLWKASMNNIKQFLSYPSKEYKKHLRLHLDHFTASCDQMIFLAGSCGLELLNVALSSQSREKLLHVFAYGPVARQHPDYPCTLIQGSKDYLSRFFFKHPDERLSTVGHMDYLQHPRVFEIIQQRLPAYVH